MALQEYDKGKHRQDCEKITVKPLLASVSDSPEVGGYVGELEKIKVKYFELIYAVSIKHPNETRHETALRYIKQAENTSDKCVEQRGS